jgi:very-short-patch-repair endonuclease
MPGRGEVLVAILPKLLDFEIARTRLWYRVPLDQVHGRLRDCWPPKWLAFYQPKVFGAEAHSINYFGRVVNIREVARHELFPDEPHDDRSLRRYCQLFLEDLRRTERPIRSPSWRRINFIPTTWRKFVAAAEINDLFDDSPLEDLVWSEFKSRGIPAQRQWRIELGGRSYFLDFAIYCASGKLDVETDGDTWHANPERAAADNLRDNDLQSDGWKLLRFGTRQIREKLGQYCVPKVVETINTMGGIDEGAIPRLLPVKQPDGSFQLGLFD